MGTQALWLNTTGNANTASGYQALYTNETGSNNTAIGASADVSVDGLSNTTALGYGAKVSASNTIQLGNTSVTKVKTSGDIEVDDTNAFYFGDSNVDGTWRIVRVGDNLVYQRREAAAWVTKVMMQP